MRSQAHAELCRMWGLAAPRASASVSQCPVSAGIGSLWYVRQCARLLNEVTDGSGPEQIFPSTWTASS
jgi:hypothetical protein